MTTTRCAAAPSTPVGHADMTMFMRLLRATAQKHGLCILVSVFHCASLRGDASVQCSVQVLIGEVCTPFPPSQQVLNDATAAGRPALGASFTFMTDVTLWLERASGQDRELRTAEVLRSRVSVRAPSPPPPLFFSPPTVLMIVCCYEMSKARCTFRIRQGRVLAS
jgi:hypothetical protein